MQMPPRSSTFSARKLTQIRNLVGEEINNALHELMPELVNLVSDALLPALEERVAARSSGGGGPVRDATFYYAQFSKCSPPMFKGAMDPVASKHWLSDVEGAFITCGCPDEFKVRCAMNLLRDGAKSWWKALTAKWSSDQILAMTWEEFREKFEAHYVPRVEQQRILNEFTSLQQALE